MIYICTGTWTDDVASVSGGRVARPTYICSAISRIRHTWICTSYLLSKFSNICNSARYLELIENLYCGFQRVNPPLFYLLYWLFRSARRRRRLKNSTRLIYSIIPHALSTLLLTCLRYDQCQRIFCRKLHPNALALPKDILGDVILNSLNERFSS